MNLKEIFELKSMPKGQDIIEFTDRAYMKVERIVKKVNEKGKKTYQYKGTISYVYSNGIRYEKVLKPSGSFKAVVLKTVEYFEMRNRQMIGYEK